MRTPWEDPRRIEAKVTVTAAVPCYVHTTALSTGDSVELSIPRGFDKAVKDILVGCSRGDLYFKNPNVARYATDELYVSIERVLRETPPSQAAIVIMELFKTHIERFL